VNKKKEDYDFLLRDVARATSAAPTYFPPANMKNEAGTEFWFVDGGVFANNPSVCAVVSAMAIFKDIPTENVTVVSIGTGVRKSDSESINRRIKEGGTIEWAFKIVDLLFDGAANVQEHQMNRLFTEGQNYFRFQCELDFDKGMDDVSAEHVSQLTNAATEASQGKWKNDYEKIMKIFENPRTSWQKMRDVFPYGEKYKDEF